MEILIVNDDKDKEVSIDWDINSIKFIQKRYQKYKIGDKEYHWLHKTSGLWHRYFLRDDGAVDFI